MQANTISQVMQSAIVNRAFGIGRTGYVIAPIVLEFLYGRSGQEYGLGLREKLRLVSLALKCSRREGAALMLGEQLTLAQAILDIPASVKGDVAEFGCFKGLTTCTLSVACQMTRRNLIVFDSFQGLPETDHHVHNFDGNRVKYEQGQYCGTLEEVRSNVAQFGAIGVCEFVPGFFADSLPGRSTKERFALIFEDADLPSSVRDVIRHAWKKLEPGCRFYSHESRDFEVVQLFFDQKWWRDELGEDAPGLVGSGIGLPLSRVGSGLAYTQRKLAHSA